MVPLLLIFGTWAVVGLIMGPLGNVTNYSWWSLALLYVIGCGGNIAALCIQ